MKILCLLMCALLLVSCASECALALPLDTEAEFSDGALTVKGRLFFDGEKMVFTVDNYKVTITKGGGEIEYDGIVFKENVIPSSRFLPLYNLLCKRMSEGLDSSLEEGNLKITFLKDTQ